MEKTVSITVPEEVLLKLQTVAKMMQRTVDDVIVNTVNTIYVAPADIPAPIANELASMQQMQDESLWEMLRPSVTTEQQERLQTLNEKQPRLSLDEIDEQQALLMAHHRSVLRRAQAMAVLTLRGYVVSDELLMQTVV